MGAESSKFGVEVGGKNKQAAAVEEATKPPSPPTESTAPKTKAKATSKPGTWLTPKAQKHATPADVRKPGTGPLVLRSVHGAAKEGSQTSKSESVVEEEQRELTPDQRKQQRKDEAKTEMIGRMNNFIKATPAKLPESMNYSLPRAAVMPERFQEPEATKVNWRGKLGNSKAEALKRMEGKKPNAEPYMPPMTQENVGGRVENSLGDTMDTFTNFQGAVHSFIQKGLTEEALEQFLFDEEAEKQLTTYEKWAVVRSAAEQVLQVYANRANANWIEDEGWNVPSVIDKESSAAGVYAGTLDTAITSGHISLLFIDDGRLSEVGEGSQVAPLLNQDLWQAIKVLAPHKVPSAHRLERLSYMGRHLLHASVSIEMWYGTSALRNLKVVLGVDCEQEQFVLNQLQQWGFFNLLPENVAILPLPRFHGFAEDPVTGRLAHVKGSPRLMLGSGYAMYLLNCPAEAYTLTPDMEPRCLDGSVLDWLRMSNSNWLMTGLFADVDRLMPEALFDTDFLTAAMYAVDRGGANMAMEVKQYQEERDMRTFDSVVLSRSSAAATTPLACGCNLRPSSMRTVKSYQVLKSFAKADGGSFVSSTHRYVFKVSSLQKMLVDPAHFHADIRLFDFYAYATFELGDITTFKGARCANILSHGETNGPDMSSVVYGKPWLIHAAKVLEAQDQVDEFRSKAIDLLRYEQLAKKNSVRMNNMLASPSSGSAFQERKQGSNILLVLTLEHAKIAPAALKLAKLFVHHIVDKLHLVVMGSSSESKGDAEAFAKSMADKELEFNGQLCRQVFMRPQDSSPMDAVQSLCTSTNASMLVVPSVRLAGTFQELGGLASSLAFSVARFITHIPVLVVKANTHGRWSLATSASQPADPSRGTAFNDNAVLTTMCLLDSLQVTPMVDFICQQMNPGKGDVLYLCKTSAFEVPGQLSMRSRRVFVQARMAVTSSLRTEERAYQNSATVELPKSVEMEGADMLVVGVVGELSISKDVEELLKTVKTSVLIFRDRDAAPPQSGLAFSIVDADEQAERKSVSRVSQSR